MKKRNISLLSFIFVGSLMSPLPARAEGWGDVGRGLIALGAAATVVGAAIWTCTQEESDADLIARAERNSTSDVVIMLTTCAQELLPYTNFYNMPEYQAERISVSLFKRMTLRNLLENTAFSLEMHADLIGKLTARIQKKNQNYQRAEEYIINIMKELVSKLKKRTELLEKTIKPFLDHNVNYLELFEYEQKLHKQYADELKNLSYYSRGVDTPHTIKRILYNKYYSYKYPYSAALDKVKEDLSILTRLLNKLSYNNYPQRAQMASWVKEQLEYIHLIVSTSAELERENIQKERDALERKQKEIERKQRELELQHERMLIEQQRERQRAHATHMKELKKERKKLKQMSEELDRRYQN